MIKWIGDIMRFGERLHEYLGIGRMKEIVGGIALGYPDPDSIANKERAPKRSLQIDWRGF